MVDGVLDVVENADGPLMELIIELEVSVDDPVIELIWSWRTDCLVRDDWEILDENKLLWAPPLVLITALDEEVEAVDDDDEIMPPIDLITEPEWSVDEGTAGETDARLVETEMVRALLDSVELLEEGVLA